MWAGGWVRTVGVAVLLHGAVPAYAQQVEPPARVARVSRVEGTVSFHAADAAQWAPAAVNLPLTTGSALWTEPGAQAEAEFPGARLVMDGGSELDITRLDAHRAVVTVPQGTVYVAVRLLPAGDTLAVETPRGTVALLGIGRYEIVAGDQVRPTAVTVVEGSADLAAAGLLVRVGLNQTATVAGDGGAVPFAANLAPAAPDAFLTAALAAERAVSPRPAAASALVAAPAFVAAMTGGEALDDVGTWDSVPDYGAVWFPPFVDGFVPYRNGRWAWLAPFGWTWVDAAPWGFAPFHYGRWAQVRERWGWIPRPLGAGVGFQPGYAPALVGFLGGAGLAGAAGWFPLGPRDPYVPAYPDRPGYARRVAQGNGGRAGITVVPSDVMASGGRVGTAVQPPPGGVLPVVARPAVVPTAVTPGITPAVMRQFRLQPQLGTGAPGPAIGPVGPRGTLPLAQVQEPGPAGSILPSGLRPGLRAGAMPGAAAAVPTPEVVRPPNPGNVAPGGPGFLPRGAGGGLVPPPGIGRPGEASRAPLPTVIAPDRPVQTGLSGHDAEDGRIGAVPSGPGVLAGSPRGVGVAGGGRLEGTPRGGAGLPLGFAPRPSLPRASLPLARGSPGIGFR